MTRLQVSNLDTCPVSPSPAPGVACTPFRTRSVIQSRVGGLCRETVADYAAAARGGDPFPPLLAYRVTDRKFPGPCLVDGFHRAEAYKRAGVAEVRVDLREGTHAEAWLAGYRANLTHGRRYTNADKREAAERALLLHRDYSAARVAEMLSVSDELVRKVRKELVASGKLKATDKVISRDGQERPTTYKPSSDVIPTVGITSDEGANDEPDPPAPEVVSVYVDEPDDEPKDNITVRSLRQVAGEFAVNGDYHAAAETDDEADELAAAIEANGGPVTRVPAAEPDPTAAGDLVGPAREKARGLLRQFELALFDLSQLVPRADRERIAAAIKALKNLDW